MKFLPILLIFATSIQMMAQELIIEEKVKFLALGDSYTIGESVPVSERWPEQFIDSLRKRGLDCDDPRIIATTGWRTDNLKNAINNAGLKPEYNLVSLLIGVNNYYQGKSVESYAPEFEELLNIAINLAGGNKANVVVVSIPDYGYTPFGKSNQPTISAGIDAFNLVNESISEKLGVKYIFITDISRRGLSEPDLVAADGLHPSGKMYSLWVKRILDRATILAPDDTGNNDEEEDEITAVKDETYGIHIYPNPFNNFIQLENIPAHLEMFLELHQVSGSEVIRQDINRNTKSIRIETDALKSGAYTLSFRQADRVLQTVNLIKL